MRGGAYLKSDIKTLRFLRVRLSHLNQCLKVSDFSEAIYFFIGLACFLMKILLLSSRRVNQEVYFSVA